MSEGWEDKKGVWVVFININDMYNNDVGKGGVRVYEAYEAKKGKITLSFTSPENEKYFFIFMM